MRLINDTKWTQLRSKYLIFLIGVFLGIFNLNAQTGKRSTVLDSLRTVLGNQEKARLLNPKMPYRSIDTQRVNTLNLYVAEAISKSNFDNVVELTEEAIRISKILRFSKGECQSHLNLGMFYLYQGEYEESINSFQSIYKIAKANHLKRETANALHSLAIVQSIQADYPNAIKNNLAALIIRDELKDKKAIANSYNNLGKIYTQIENHEEALRYHKKALEIRLELDDKLGLQNSYTNFGNLLFKINDFDGALMNYKEALKISNETHDELERVNLNMNIGSTLLIKKQDQESLLYFENAQKSFRKLGNKLGMAQNFINISTCYHTLNNFDLSKLYMDSAIHFAKEIGAISLIKDSYKILEERDTSNEDWLSAYNNHYMYLYYRDSLFNEENTEKIIESELNYEFEKKQLAAQKEMAIQTLNLEFQKKQALAKSEKEKQELIFEQEIKQQQIEFEYSKKLTKLELEKKQQDILNTALAKENVLMAQNSRNESYIRWLMFVVLLVLVAFGWNFRNNLIRQKTDNIKITKQKEDLKSLINELNHRVKNNFQTVISMLRIQTYSLKDERLVEILTETSNRFLAISNVHQKLYQTKAFSEIEVKDYLNELAIGISNQFSSTSKDFELFIKDELHLKLNIETAIPLALIFNELITNSFKHAKQDNKNLVVKIEFIQTSQISYMMTYHDNGSGLPIDFSKTGNFGSTLLKLFAEQLQGEIRFENNKGAFISLDFRRL